MMERTAKTLLLILAASATTVASATAASCNSRNELVSLPLADFASSAELKRPPIGVRERGIVVLFAGSDVADRDSAIVGADGTIVSRPLRQIAERLSCAGYASLRYNKRYVSDSTTVDRERFDRLNGSDLVDDGRTALLFVRSRPDLRQLPTAVMGWSQGTTVAMGVAAAESTVRAIVLMAPVIDSPARTAQADYLRIGKPYLERYATAGSLDADAIARADAGPGGMLAHVFVRMFRGFEPGERVNPLLDVNQDGRINFVEADPIIASWYADVPGSGLGMDGTDRALKGVADAYSASTPSLLILQGLNDGNVSPDAARAFANRPDSRGRVTLLTYPGLGHSLAPAPSAVEDQLLPTADRSLDDLVRWLDRTLARAKPRREGRAAR